MKNDREKCVRSSIRGTWAALGLAMMALWFAPCRNAQSAAGAAAPASSQGANASGTKPAASGGATGAATANAGGAAGQASSSTQNTPQMVDLSATPGDSLGEAARKARAQKAKTSTPKVYTEDSVSQLSGHGVSVVGEGGGASSGSSGGEGASGVSEEGNSAPAPAAGASSEDYWRGKARAIHDRMAEIDAQISSIQADIDKNGAVQIDPQTGANSGVIYVKDRNEQIRQLQAQKDAQQSQLEALEDEGRKAGADSGWFR
jgi:hypothetical protein